jgi:hypothetical protein
MVNEMGNIEVLIRQDFPANGMHTVDIVNQTGEATWLELADDNPVYLALLDAIDGAWMTVNNEAGDAPLLDNNA